MARVQKRSSASSDNDNHDMARPFRESSPQTYKPGARSCLGCHRRKVRCDRGVPCANCSKCGLTCAYRTKNSEVARKCPTLQDISDRLERMEGLLSRSAEGSRVTTVSAAESGGGGGGGRDESQSQVQVHFGASINAAAEQHPSDQPSGRSTWELLLNDGHVVQYVNNSNIEILPRDVSLDLFLYLSRSLLSSVKVSHILPAELMRRWDQEERIENVQSAGSGTASSHLQKTPNAHHTLHTQPGACAPSNMVSDVLEFYPDPQLALRLWTVYVKSVDPVLKILHIPTAQSVVVATILDPRSAESSTVALTFAIYFAAVTAIGHEDKDEAIELPCEKPVLLKRYKMSLDRLLMVPDLMNRPCMTALQALAIYVVSTGARPEINHVPSLGRAI